MRRPFLLAVLLSGILAAAATAGLLSSGTSLRAPSAAEDVPARASLLSFDELLDDGQPLGPSQKALALDGRRVRVVGFMAEMEAPLTGAFYLVPRPLALDESGGGTADLPLESILIEVPGRQDQPIAHVDGPLQGTGVLEVGNRADEHGRVASFRLRLDAEQRLAHGGAVAAASSTNERP